MEEVSNLATFLLLFSSLKLTGSIPGAANSQHTQRLSKWQVQSCHIYNFNTIHLTRTRSLRVRPAGCSLPLRQPLLPSQWGCPMASLPSLLWHYLAAHQLVFPNAPRHGKPAPCHTPILFHFVPFHYTLSKCNESKRRNGCSQTCPLGGEEMYDMMTFSFTFSICLCRENAEHGEESKATHGIIGGGRASLRSPSCIPPLQRTGYL